MDDMDMDDNTQDQYWAGNQPQEGRDGFPDQEMLDFQNFDQSSNVYADNMYMPSPYPQTPYAGSAAGHSTPVSTVQQERARQRSSFFEATISTNYSDLGAASGGMGLNGTEFDELPLLEELEIYPQRILEKSLAVLNPFPSKEELIDSSEYLFKETDLAGPITFCLTLAACLSISDSKAQFGYIYGLSAISVLVMFCLIWLMCNSLETQVTISAVASVLGYSMLPIVGLSFVGVFVTLNNLYGVVVTCAAILLATVTSSRMFCLMTDDPHQRYLIAYPCTLLYALFSLLVLF